MRTHVVALSAAALGSVLAASSAHAQEVLLLRPQPSYTEPRLSPQQMARGARIELTTGVGVLGRSTTGTMPGYGYDAGAALGGRANVRVFFEPFADCNCQMRHGFDLGTVHAAGSGFGINNNFAWRQYVFDAAYAFHMRLPCMSNQHIEMTLTGLAGLTGQWADAGLGDVARDDTSDFNARMSAAASYDHAAIGWRFGAAFDMRVAGFVLGIEGNMRDLYGIQSNHARSFLMELGLRIGGQFQLTPSRRAARGGYYD